MIIVTTETIAHKNITKTIGIVKGNTVQSKHIGRDIMAGLKTIIGGELRGYTELLEEAREKSLHRMISSAGEMGADAIVNVRFTTSAITTNASEILVFGTAVKLE